MPYGREHYQECPLSERLGGEDDCRCDEIVEWLSARYGVNTCAECDGPSDDRVRAGMKCARCAYGEDDSDEVDLERR